MFRIAGVLCVFLVLSTCWARDVGPTVENHQIRVTLIAESGGLRIEDKRNNTVYETYAQRVPRLTPHHMDLDIRADGYLDEWPKAAEHRVIFGPEHLVFGNAVDDLHAAFLLTWDADDLYIAARLGDNTPSEVASKSEFWLGDSLEFWVNGTQYGVGMFEGQPFLWKHKSGDVPGGAVAVRQDGTVRTYEIAIPAVELGFENGFKHDNQFAFALALNLSDEPGTRAAQYAYPEHMQWGNSGSFANVTLERNPDMFVAGMGYDGTARALNIKKRRKTLAWDHPDGFRMVLTLARKAPEFSIDITGDTEQPFHYGLNYPAPLVFDTPDARLLIPHFEGLMLPVRGEFVGRDRMPKPWGAQWMGATDLKTGAGYMVFPETFTNSSFEMKTLARTGEEPILVAAPRWLAEKGKFGFQRRMVYYLTDDGGYVALAKRYRQFAKEYGYFKTLKEKAAENPEVNKLKGAISMYPADLANVSDFAKYLKRNGIDRAMLNAGHKTLTRSWMPEDLDNAEEIRRTVDLGYLVSYYDIYTDMPEKDGPEYWWYDSPRFENYDYPSDIIKDWKGDPQKGWYDLNDNGQQVNCNVVCPTIRYQKLLEYMPGHLERYPANAHFVDCETKVWLYECYDENHPLTQRENMATRCKILGHLSNELKLITGSEGGKFWALPYVHYSEDIMSTSISWSDVKPNQMDGPVHYDECPDYLRTEFGWDIRVPLFELAFHDCLYTTFRWDQGNLREPHLMWKRDMLNLLYGTAPIWMLRKAGMGLLVGEEERLLSTYKTVCDVNKYTQFEEMLDHKFLSDDYTLQRTYWPGDLSITVNFSETETHETPEGIIMPPASYLLLGETAKYSDLPIRQVIDAKSAWKPSEESERLLYNGDFEEDDLALMLKNGPAKLSIVSNDTFEGDGALLVKAMDNRGWGYCSFPLGQLKPGNSYRISARIKLLDHVNERDLPLVDFVAMCDDQPGQPLQYHHENLPKKGQYRAGAWVLWQGTIEVPASYYSGYINIGRPTYQPGGAMFLVDNVQVTPVN